MMALLLHNKGGNLPGKNVLFTFDGLSLNTVDNEMLQKEQEAVAQC